MQSRNNNTPRGRKRPRSQNESEDAQSAPSVPSTTKRRRLEETGTDEVTDDLTENPPSLISTATNGVLGRRLASVGSRPSPAKKIADGADPWEIPDSEDERSNHAPLPRKKAQPVTKKTVASASKGKSGLRDGAGSADELNGTTLTPRKPRQRKGAGTTTEPKPKPKASAKPTGSGQGKRGRQTKVAEEEEEEEEEAQEDAEEDAATATDTPTKPRSAKRPQPPTINEPEGGVSDEELKSTSPAPRTLIRGGDLAGLQVDSARKPRGILTPSKQDGDRRRKSVAFNSASGGGKKRKVEKTFEDAVSKATDSVSKSARGRKKAAEQSAAGAEDEEKEGGDDGEVNGDGEDEDEEEEDEEDDEVCAICSKPDSKKGNEIIFCDNCDKGVHQKCYGLAVIPEGDWICRDCSQEEATSSLAANGKSAAVVARGDERPDIQNFERHLREMQRVLLDRCAGRRRIKLRGQDEAYEKASQLVEQTIVAGEGNSMLVIGARGCGKTTLVESIVSDMSKDHKDQFHVVRLNGFIHTDDKLALREIWRQLGKEMEVEDELINKTKNYGDTMASLLALLSHPSEIADAHEGVTSKSVVFLIDEFDLFATHARQTLLYNLFDIAQARKAPIAVLGLTTRIDVVESLEKRVKSRFSHRYVYLSLPKTLQAYWDVCRQGLSVDEDDMAAEGIDTTLDGHREFWEWWNGQVETLRKTRAFQDLLEAHYCSTKSVSAFLTTCILPLSALSPASPSLQIPGVDGLSLEPAGDAKLHVLEALSDLDLSMLIAAARLDIIAHTDTVNFAMAYDEYASLMGRQRVQSAASGMLALGGGARVWGRGTAGTAWERLVTLGMLIPAATVGRGAAGQSGLDAKMWKVDVALEEIPTAVKLNAVLGRWCREI